eukprot:774169-Prymnesium_polylepis.1
MAHPWREADSDTVRYPEGHLTVRDVRSHGFWLPALPAPPVLPVLSGVCNIQTAHTRYTGDERVKPYLYSR